MARKNGCIRISWPTITGTVTTAAKVMMARWMFVTISKMAIIPPKASMTVFAACISDRQHTAFYPPPQRD